MNCEKSFDGALYGVLVVAPRRCRRVVSVGGHIASVTEGHYIVNSPILRLEEVDRNVRDVRSVMCRD